MVDLKQNLKYLLFLHILTALVIDLFKADLTDSQYKLGAIKSLVITRTPRRQRPKNDISLAKNLGILHRAMIKRTNGEIKVCRKELKLKTIKKTNLINLHRFSRTKPTLTAYDLMKNNKVTENSKPIIYNILDPKSSYFWQPIRRKSIDVDDLEKRFGHLYTKLKNSSYMPIVNL